MNFYAAIACVLLWAGQARAQPRRFDFWHGQMGTRFHIALYAPDSVQAARAAQAAFARIDTLNQVLSDYFAESELNQVAAQAGSGRWLPVSAHLYQVARLAQEAARLTGGRFDLTVGPLVQLWRRAARQQALPDAQRLAQAKKLVNYRWLKAHRREAKIKLTKKGMRLDAGGIGKGYANAQALQVLQAQGFAQAMIAGGGDLCLGAPPPNSSGWRVALGDTVLTLAHTSVATSGDTYRYVELNGTRYSHVVDPRTGLGLTHRLLVTVVLPNAALADALASGLGVQGAEPRILRRTLRHLGKKLPGLQVWVRQP